MTKSLYTKKYYTNEFQTKMDNTMLELPKILFVSDRVSEDVPLMFCLLRLLFSFMFC